MPTYFPDVPAALDLVVARLTAVDVEAAIDTAHVHAPGAWVSLSKSNPFPVDLLSGEGFVGVEVAVVVGALPLPEAYRQLTELAAEVVETLGHPDGPIRVQETLFGNDPVALPTLVLPYYVEGSPTP